MGLNKQTLINLMSYPNEISDSEVAELVETVQNYPYFQLGRSLFAKALHDKQAPNAYDALSKAAIYAPDRRLLRALFYEDLHIDRNANHAQAPSEENIEEEVSSTDEHHSISSSESFSTPESYEPPVDSDTSLTPQEDEVIQSDEVYNELEENLRKLRESKNKFSEEEDEEEKKKIAESSDSQNLTDTGSQDTHSSIVLEELANQETVSTQFGNNQQLQNELIDKFINSQDNLSLKIKPSADETEEVEDLSSQSTEIGDNLVSENLAKIYIRQGKKDKAIEIYQKLIWKYPQKKAYFAETIESLKAE